MRCVISYIKRKFWFVKPAR